MKIINKAFYRSTLWLNSRELCTCTNLDRLMVTKIATKVCELMHQEGRVVSQFSSEFVEEVLLEVGLVDGLGRLKLFLLVSHEFFLPVEVFWLDVYPWILLIQFLHKYFLLNLTKTLNRLQFLNLTVLKHKLKLPRLNLHLHSLPPYTKASLTVGPDLNDQFPSL